MSTPLRSPNFLKAVTPEGLCQLMLKNNLSKEVEHNYFQILKEGSFWYAFYYETAKMQNLPKKKVDDPFTNNKTKKGKK